MLMERIAQLCGEIIKDILTEKQGRPLDFYEQAKVNHILSKRQSELQDPNTP